MASQKQPQQPPKLSPLESLADEILQRILDLAMERDSPFIIDSPPPGPNRHRKTPILQSSAGSKDHLFNGFKGDTPVHQRTPQSVHKMDWIAMNGTSRRIRVIGKLAFFRAKVFAIPVELPGRVACGEFGGFGFGKMDIGGVDNGDNKVGLYKRHMLPDDQKLFLSYARSILLFNARETAPMFFLKLPEIFPLLKSLRICTFLFGFCSSIGNADDPEWITAAYILRGPVANEMKEACGGIGIGGSIFLEEAVVGEEVIWKKHRESMKKWIYPMLRIKAEILRSKKE